MINLKALEPVSQRLQTFFKTEEGKKFLRPASESINSNQLSDNNSRSKECFQLKKKIKWLGQ